MNRHEIIKFYTPQEDVITAVFIKSSMNIMQMVGEHLKGRFKDRHIFFCRIS